MTTRPRQLRSVSPIGRRRRPFRVPAATEPQPARVRPLVPRRCESRTRSPSAGDRLRRSCRRHRSAAITRWHGCSRPGSVDVSHSIPVRLAILSAARPSASDPALRLLPCAIGQALPPGVRPRPHLLEGLQARVRPEEVVQRVLPSFALHRIIQHVDSVAQLFKVVVPTRQQTLEPFFRQGHCARPRPRWPRTSRLPLVRRSRWR